MPAHDPARRARVRRRVLLLLACLAALATLHRPILRGIGSWLVVSDDVRPAAAAYVLNGDVHVRPQLAAALFRAGTVQRIILPGVERGPAVQLGVYPSETEAGRRVLELTGIPADRIEILPTEVTSTRDEAAALAAYAQRTGLRSVVVVTTEVHTRRTRWLFRRALRDTGVELQVAGAPDWQYDLARWWTDEQGLLDVVNEYLKLIHNRLAG